MSTFLAAGAIGRPRAAPEAAAPPAAVQRAKVALSMYTDLPAGEIAIEEFERFAMDRLRGACRVLAVLRPYVGMAADAWDVLFPAPRPAPYPS